MDDFKKLTEQLMKIYSNAASVNTRFGTDGILRARLSKM